jgi:hypothetical protein
MCKVCDAREREAEFEAWIDTLREDVIQEEYGYEPGEFDVFPGMWKPLFLEGLEPSEAFKRALDDFVKHRTDAQPAWKK